MPNQNSIPDDQIAQLIKSDPDKIRRMVAASSTSELRKSYEKHLLDDKGASVVALNITDWRSIQMLLAEVPGADNNPGGGAFQHLLDDVKEAISVKDAARLFQDLLLIYKAVGRS